jgi:hypothetical protein
MHAGDLGTFADALGSLFFLEVDHKEWYRSREVGLQALNKDLGSYYKANRGLSRIIPLVFAQILAKDPGYPFLKGKAAQVRHLAEYGLLLANRHRHGDQEHVPFRFKHTSKLAEHTDEHLELLVAMFQGMARYFRSINAEPFKVDDCKEAMFTYLQALAGLHRLWRRGLAPHELRGLPFQIRPKAHVLQHMVQDQIELYGSPKQVWCYLDEDFVGSVKSIAAKTKSPNSVESMALYKLMILEGLNVHP